MTTETASTGRRTPLTATCLHKAIICLILFSLGLNGQAAPIKIATVSPETVALVPLFETDPFPNFQAQAMTVAYDGTDRVFVGLRNSEVWVFDLDDLAAGPSLYLESRHGSPGYAEEGIVAITLHPDFATNGYFYIYDIFAEGSGPPQSTKRPKIQRFQADPSTATTVNVATQTDIYTFSAYNVAHMGGGLAFGPDDGFLYFTYGDGRDFCHTVEDPMNEHGKILRIDVDGGTPYAIPGDNPQPDDPQLPELWAMGFRNPFRIAFDQVTGDLYLGDVGDRNREEINLIRPNMHYGWPFWEGELCHRYDPPPSVDCETNGQLGNCSAYPAENFVFPLHTYPDFLPASDRESVTAGYVYRGSAFPELQGAFIHGDYEIGSISYFFHDGVQATMTGDLVTESELGIVSIVPDPDGEPLILDVNDGAVYRLESTRTGAGAEWMRAE
jgi:glucose/arabinose dehydrogenase